MRSIAFILAVAVISAALAEGAGAQERIRLADRHQLHDELQFAGRELPNHLRRARGAHIEH